MTTTVSLYCRACSPSTAGHTTIEVEHDRHMEHVFDSQLVEAECDHDPESLLTDDAALLEKVREKNAGSFDGAPFYSLDGAWENAARDPHRLDMARRDGFGRRM